MEKLIKKNYKSLHIKMNGNNKKNAENKSDYHVDYPDLHLIIEIIFAFWRAFYFSLQESNEWHTRITEQMKTN